MQKLNELFVKDKIKKLESLGNTKLLKSSSKPKEKLDTYKKDMKSFLKM
jgi:hypothetical protein